VVNFFAPIGVKKFTTKGYPQVRGGPGTAGQRLIITAMISDEGSRLGIGAARRLAELNCCDIGPGLTDAEFTRIEHEYGFEFADDHRAFLAIGLPLCEPLSDEDGVIHTWENPWPDWRNGSPAELRYHLNWEVDFLIELVEAGRWHPRWGAKPADRGDAVEVARLLLAQAPKLVPVHAHRFLPAGRGTFGRAVLSMWGFDVICYGADLADYIDHEFAPPPEGFAAAPRPDAIAPFWRDLL
jgi:hypothetical protein